MKWKEKLNIFHVMLAYSKACVISHIYNWNPEEWETELMYEAVISCDRTVFFSHKKHPQNQEFKKTAAWTVV